MVGEVSTYLLELISDPLPIESAHAHELDTEQGTRLLLVQAESDLKCFACLIGVGRLADDREGLWPVLLSLEDPGEQPFAITEVSKEIDC